MGWFKRLFGEGSVRAEIITEDGEKGIVKFQYEGNPGSNEEMIERIKKEVLVAEGIKVKGVKIIART